MKKCLILPQSVIVKTCSEKPTVPKFCTWSDTKSLKSSASPSFSIIVVEINQSVNKEIDKPKHPQWSLNLDVVQIVILPLTNKEFRLCELWQCAQVAQS